MKILFIIFAIFIFLIDKGQNNDKEINKDLSKEWTKENKIKIEKPNMNIQPSPKFIKCGVDNLKIKPIEISEDNIISKNNENK